MVAPVFLSVRLSRSGLCRNGVSLLPSRQKNYELANGFIVLNNSE